MILLQMCIRDSIWTARKVWSNHSDVVLSTLSRGMINRKLFKVEVTSSSITKARKEEILLRISKQLNINKKEAKYFLSISSIENNMYKKEDDSIEIKMCIRDRRSSVFCLVKPKER